MLKIHAHPIQCSMMNQDPFSRQVHLTLATITLVAGIASWAKLEIKCWIIRQQLDLAIDALRICLDIYQANTQEVLMEWFPEQYALHTQETPAGHIQRFK